MEEIMHKRLISFLNNHSINNSKQHVFCKGKTKMTTIAEFIERVYNSLDEREISMTYC
jgi:hypothetical protein